MFVLTSLFYVLLAFLGLGNRPDAPPTDGITNGGVCSGLKVRDGRVSCSNDGHQTVCRVVCDRKDQGEFTCTKDEGWSPELPTCARPIEESEERIPAGCPDDAKCDVACREDPRFRTGGSCVGPHKELCSCGPIHHATEQPLNAAACNVNACKVRCFSYDIRTNGVCVRGRCKCRLIHKL